MKQLLKRLALYLRTARWLRPDQLAWFVYRRLRPQINPAPVPVESVRSLQRLHAWAVAPQPTVREFRFLNVGIPAAVAAIDWHPAGMSRLWRYNLHYFDYLQWQVFTAAEKATLINSWIISNPPGMEDAWEPYTVSLRIVNWIKFFATSGQTVPVHWQESLVNQANWLRFNLEFHIRANHLLKNAKALVFAGTWFDGPTGSDLLAVGQKIFLREVCEQFLSDGGHYERAPMYHSIAVEDCLDVVNLFGAAFEDSQSVFIRTVADKAHAGLHFLDSILGGDRRIPLFNDSAHGIAPDPQQLIGYGNRVLGYQAIPAADEVRQINMHASGIYGYRKGWDSLLLDCGAIGPPYQPGHTHCDLLSYELCINGRKLIVDPGVHGYEDDATRPYLRSTAAHNTVRINGEEQSEIWGTFRVARRARPGFAALGEVEAGGLRFHGCHDGYLRLPQKVMHSRQVQIDTEGRWQFDDSFTGSGFCEAESFVHFASAVSLQPDGANRWTVLVDDHSVLRILASPDCTALVETAYVCQEFGQLEPATVLVMRRAAALPFSMQYTLERCADRQSLNCTIIPTH